MKHRALIALLQQTVERLAAWQYLSDGATYFRGEFPMRLSGPVSRVDHNYLSGYTLLHVVRAACRPNLPSAVSSVLHQIMARAADLPARYQSPRSTGNWYSDHGNGLTAPADYPWPDGRILCLRDDYDDTAISALLCGLGPFRSRAPFGVELFLSAAYEPERDTLVAKSKRRLELCGVQRDIYQSWVLDDPWADTKRCDVPAVWLPEQNSLELTTVANVFSAVHLLGGQPELAAQRASRAFVNDLAWLAVDKLLAGDASYLDFASSYYPRVPFAPLAFLVHNHLLTSNSLLGAAVVELIARAVEEVDPHVGWRMQSYANPVYWLNCCAWCLVGGYLTPGRVQRKMEAVWEEICTAVDDEGTWPDIVFFYDAHLGHYSGAPYAHALLAETTALLKELGWA